MKKAILNINDVGQVFDVVDITEVDKYTSRPICIEYGDLILPIVSPDSKQPGMYRSGPVFRPILPSKKDEETYHKKNVVNFSDYAIRDFIQNTNVIAEEQKIRIANDSGDVFAGEINQNTTATMALFREALNRKQIVLDSYQDRFEEGKYNNHKRSIVQDDDVTLKRLITWCDVFDLQVDITLSDKEGNVANPMGNGVSISRRIV